MAETRTVLIGTGALLVVVGSIGLTPVSGIGIIFVILGLVMWARHDADRGQRPAATYLCTLDDAAEVVLPCRRMRRESS